MHSDAKHGAALALVWLLASAASAQSTSPLGGWSFDEPVEAGVADLGPLDASLRLERYDLRSPDQWDQVYRMRSVEGDWFARRSGGLTALFSQSQYIDSPYGPLAEIPASTVYIIGDPTPEFLRSIGLLEPEQSQSPSGSGQGIDQRIDSSVARRLSTRYEPPAQGAIPPAEVGAQLERDQSIWYNDQLRQARVRRLLELARKVEGS
jgi:hypothetical protein